MSFIEQKVPHVGDLVRVRRKQGYAHFGIAVAPDRVVHFTGAEGDLSKDSGGIMVRETSLSLFLQNDVLEVENTCKSPFKPEEIVDRARKFVGSTKFRNMSYNFITNNCEHFARYVYSGKARCYQVRKGVVAAGATAAVVAAGVVTKAVVNAVKTATKKK